MFERFSTITNMQQGSLGYDAISLLVFGGTVFVSQIQTTAIYMYVLVQFD